MCETIKSDFDKKKIKSKSMFGYCNNLFGKILPNNQKSMLATDALPMDNNSPNNLQSNELVERNVVPQLQVVPSTNAAVPSSMQMQLVQNNQANQNVTVIEHQQNLHISHSTGLTIGTVVHMGSNSRKNSEGSYDDKSIHKKTKTIVELMNCADEIEPQAIKIAAKSIGGDWRMVLRDLDGISDAEIDQIKEQYFHISVEEVIYQLLLRWQRNCDDPSLGKLSTVLWENDKYDCVVKLKNYYKKYKKRNDDTNKS